MRRAFSIEHNEAKQPRHRVDLRPAARVRHEAEVVPCRRTLCSVILRRLVTWSVLTALSLAACTPPGTPSPTAPASGPSDAGAAAAAALEREAATNTSPALTQSEPLRLVTLGDSYTHGTDEVERRDTWPQQLVRAMRGEVRLRLVENLADVTNTSEYVLLEQLQRVAPLQPDVVTLLVGANDVVAPGITLEDYDRNIRAILDGLLELLPPQRLFVITTPDHSLTARGGDYEAREVARAEIEAVNEVLSAAAAERGIAVIDISPVSDRVVVDPTLVGADGLHPSAKQYAGWVEIIAPIMRRVLLSGET